MLGTFAFGQEALASLEPCVQLVTTDTERGDLTVAAGTRGDLTPTVADEPGSLDVLTTIC
jgi:hypothetical protein